MKVIETGLPGVVILEPKVFGDERGFFFESFNRKVFAATVGVDPDFVQDNHSRSSKNVLRGLHYQVQRPQGKLIRLIAGEIYDVVVDIRRGSPHFGKWTAATLSAENKRMVWAPQGFAHGFLVLSEQAEVLYKTTDYYAPQCERCILWNDAELAIEWPLQAEPVLSAKDRAGTPFALAETFP